MTKAQPSRIEIATLRDGRGTLMIDGVDLSRLINGFTIEATAGSGVEISLRLRQGLTLDLSADDPAIEMIRESLIAQQDCICAEILPTFTHSARLEINPACPIHGEKEKS